MGATGFTGIKGTVGGHVIKVIEGQQINVKVELSGSLQAKSYH